VKIISNKNSQLNLWELSVLKLVSEHPVDFFGFFIGGWYG